MSGFSTYLGQQLINHVLVKSQTYTPPTGTYLALFTSDPTDDNVTANEITGAWYGRKEITAWSAAVPTPSSPNATSVVTDNSNTVTFNAVTGSAVSITHWGIYDALTTGNLLFSGAWDVARTLNVTDVFTVASGDMNIGWL